MRVIRLVIDTNVLVSGLRSNQGASFELLSLVDRNKFTLCVSVPLIVEYEKVLSDPRVKIPLSKKEIGRIIDYLCFIAEKQKIYYLWRPRLPDPGDDMLLELAVAGNCNVIVTFNLKDFAGAEHFGIQVLTPKQLLKLIEKENA